MCTPGGAVGVNQMHKPKVVIRPCPRSLQHAKINCCRVYNYIFIFFFIPLLCFRVWCACFYLLLPWWHDHPLTHVGHQLIRLPLFLASSNNIFEFRLPSVSDSSFCILFTHKHNCDDNYRRKQIDSVGRDSCEYSPPRQRERACVYVQ